MTPTLQVGKCYYRKSGLTVHVRKVERIDGDDVYYRVLYGSQLKRRTHNRTRKRNFLRWSMGEVEELSDYSHLNGCKKFETFVVRNTRGEPILRCNEHKARFYLRKGYAREVEPDVLQFTDDMTEKKLEELYLGEFSAFFMAVKNDRCVVCGKECMLTRHSRVFSTNIHESIPAFVV